MDRFLHHLRNATREDKLIVIGAAVCAVALLLLAVVASAPEPM